MIERRCNFCGDLIEDGIQSHNVTLDHRHGGKFTISILVGQDLPDQFSDDARRENPFYYFQHNKPKREDTFDTCFGCAADLVAVARDQYAKEKR